MMNVFDRNVDSENMNTPSPKQGRGHGGYGYAKVKVQQVDVALQDNGTKTAKKEEKECIYMDRVLCRRALFYACVIYVPAMILYCLLIKYGMPSQSTLPMLTPKSSSAVQSNHLHQGTGAVLVTGATGRLGSILYHNLKDRDLDVRAFVRNVEKARDLLQCNACDETEGIYVGDLTNPRDLEHAMADGSVSTLAIAAGAGAGSSSDVQREIEFNSVVNSVKALGMASHSRGRNNRYDLRVVLCSSMGTNQTPQPSWGGDILFWKLNAEAFLSTSGISSTVIVKPCGLPEGMAGKNSTLMVGHNGTFIDKDDDGSHHRVSREDVASVMAEAVTMSHSDDYGCDNVGEEDPDVNGSKSKTCHRRRTTNLRFDLCSRPGPVTTDLKGLIESARWEWDM